MTLLQRWLSATVLCCHIPLALAIVLPPVPNTDGSTATPPTVVATTKNSPATQALIDQLFTDATYLKFAPQTPATLDSLDNNP